jgi:hypothetical protein
MNLGTFCPLETNWHILTPIAKVGFDHFVPFAMITGVNVLKVIPRPTALRAVGKNYNYRLKAHTHTQCF